MVIGRRPGPADGEPVAMMVIKLDEAPAEPTAAPAEPTEAMAEPTEAAGPTTEADFAVMPGGYLERALTGEFAGTEVTVDGPFTNPDDIRFAESMAAFEDATGITVNYIGNKEFEASIAIRVDAGDAPDIVDFPQPVGPVTMTRDPKRMARPQEFGCTPKTKGGAGGSPAAPTRWRRRPARTSSS